MKPINILLISFIVVLNIFVWIILPFIINKQSKLKKSNIQRIITQSVQLIFSVLSVFALLKFLGVRVQEYLSKSLITLGKDIVISGYLLLFIIVSIFVLISLNRILSRVIRQAKGAQNYPKALVNGIRHWVTFVVFIILVSGVLKFAHIPLFIFSSTLFEFQEVPITLNKLIQAAFIAYTVHIALLGIESFYSERIRKKGIDWGKGHTIFQILKYFIWVITIVIILSSLGLSVNVLLAGSAALFVGLGFGLQTLFNDFVSGLIILFEGTIRVNDVVEIEDGIIGRVQEIGLRTSKILTRDNIIMIIPNNNFTGKNVINWSYNEHKTRFKVDVGVAYGSDVRLVEKILIDCAQENEKIYTNPKPFVYFNDFGESSLDFSLFFWIDESFWVEKVRSDLRFAIDKKFRENGVEIPFPQRDLHIRSGYKD